MSKRWNIPKESSNVAVKQFEKYLRNNGFRDSTIKGYLSCIKVYLRNTETDRPTVSMAELFRESLVERRLSRSTINNYSFAIQQYHNMIKDPVKLPFLKRNDTLPYYFDEEDVLKIFYSCTNLKHLAMLKVLFYGGLRASEICHLEDSDVDLKGLTLRIREGKGGRDGVVFISEDCAVTLRRYLEVRPPMEIDGKKPLFYTDRGRLWLRTEVNWMFNHYKAKAGIQKVGAVHCFARHSPATILISKGCDIRVVQTLLRHKDIKTTARYCHLSEETARYWHKKGLSLGA